MGNKIDLGGKVAVVTGGAQGIGRAVVERFLASGARVAIWDRDVALAEKTAAAFGADGTARAFGVDVTRLAEVEQARDATLKGFGRIDILVNNAGFDRGASLLNVKEEDWDAVLGVHLKGTLNCIQAVVPHMVENRYGKIVNT